MSRLAQPQAATAPRTQDQRTCVDAVVVGLAEIEKIRQSATSDAERGIYDYLANAVRTYGSLQAAARHCLDLMEQEVARELDALLAQHNVRKIVANGRYGHELKEPVFFAEQDGRRYVVVPPAMGPAELRAFARAHFAAEATQ